MQPLPFRTQCGQRDFGLPKNGAKIIADARCQRASPRPTQLVAMLSTNTPSSAHRIFVCTALYELVFIAPVAAGHLDATALGSARAISGQIALALALILMEGAVKLY